MHFHRFSRLYVYENLLLFCRFFIIFLFLFFIFVIYFIFFSFHFSIPLPIFSFNLLNCFQGQQLLLVILSSLLVAAMGLVMKLQYKLFQLPIQVYKYNFSVCVLHVDFHSDNYANIRLLIKNVTKNFDKWTKDQQSLNARKKSQKKTKYEDVLETLGHSFKCNYGCHTRCYKNFTAVPVSQSTKPSTSTVSTRSKVLLNRAAQKSQSSKSNILPNLCIFCAKGGKKSKGNN